MAEDKIVSTLLDEKGAIALAAALAVGLSALASAWSQSSVGAGAMGAVSERPELAGKVLIWIAIPETIVLLGFLISIMLIFVLGGE